MKYKKNKDLQVQKFTKLLIKNGNKGVAEKIIKKVFKNLIKKLPSFQNVSNPLEIIHLAFINAEPSLEICSVKRGGTIHQVPKSIPVHRRQTIGMRWIIEATSKIPKHKCMSDKLTDIFIDTALRQGVVVVRKINLHKVAESNRAFSHLKSF